MVKKQLQKKKPAARPKPEPAAASAADLDLKKIMEVLGKTDVCEFEYSRGDMHIVLKKEPVSVILGETETAQTESGPAEKNLPVLDEKACAQTCVKTLKSPAVGIFHISDGNTLIASVGKKIKKGQRIGWVNSMGINQEIMAEKNSKITAILCKDREVVEWGQKLFEIEENNV
ncbi:MAG: biotin/lipoyl-containing protein [Elusimicrobiota bacterium]|nr:biotin/lipoyl-containing protein [Elusimicrobiota bacterium]